MTRFFVVCCIIGAMFGLVGCGGEDQNKTSDGTQTVAPKPSEPIDVTFKINGLPPGPCKLIGMVGSTNFMLDSIVPGPDGVIKVKRDTAISAGLYFLVLPQDKVMQWMVDQDQTFSLTADFSNPARTAKIEGSLDMTLLYENLVWEEDFQARFQPVAARYAAAAPGSPEWVQADAEQKKLIEERQAHLQSFKQRHPDAFFTQYKLAGQNPKLTEPKRPDGSIDQDLQLIAYRNAYWDNTPLNDERLLHTPVIANKLATYITQITPQVADSVIKYADIVIEKSKGNQQVFKFVVNWIAIEYNKPKTMGGEAVFVHVVDKYFTPELAFWSTPDELKEVHRVADEMKPSLLGKIGQDLNCTTPDGKQLSLYSLKSPLKVVWIWNYECEHCQERTPIMKQVMAKLKPRGVDIFSLCTGADEKQWKAFIQKYGIQSWNNVYDPKYGSNYYKKYHVDNTPELYLLDANNRIVAKDLHPDQLTEEVDEQLKLLSAN